MRQGAEGKRVLVCAARFTQHRLYEVSCADVMDEIREQPAAKGVVAEV
jgi:hypothetical protein